MILSEILNRLGISWGVENTPLVSPPPDSSPFDKVEVFYQRDLVFQPDSSADLGFSLRSSRDFYRDFNFFGNDIRPYLPPTSSRADVCPILQESIDFFSGTSAGLPTPPTVNCYRGQLPQQEGWSTVRFSMPGTTRGALVYHPPMDRSVERPVVVWFHGTQGGSVSVSQALFNEEEARRVMGDEAIIIILEARDFMLPDWEHHGLAYDHFWNTTTDSGDRNRDILFVDALIRAAISQYGADAQRIFFMGHSNGGFAALHFGTALRSMVRGVAMSASGWVEHPPKRSMVFASRNCADILEIGRDYFSRTNRLYPYARPISRFPEEGMPAFYIRGNSRDVDVSAYYTCALDEQLRALPNQEVTTDIVNWVNPDKPQEGYHFVDHAFLISAWEYLRNLPRR